MVSDSLGETYCLTYQYAVSKERPSLGRYVTPQIETYYRRNHNEMGNINSVLFQPPRPTRPLQSSRKFWIKTSMGENIAAVFIPRKDATVTILFSHGNAEDLGTSYVWLRVLAENLNVNVMSYDYTGYGESTGSPSEQHCYDDIESAYQYLLKDRHIRPEQIVLYGRSLGSGPSCYLAAKTAESGRNVAGLILHAPFTSIYRVVLSFPFTMVGDKFPNIDLIPRIECPVFIVHGTMDNVVPFDHGQTLYNRLPSALRAEPFWAEGLDHNDVELFARRALLTKLNKFLDFYVLARQLWVLKPRSLSQGNFTRTSSERDTKSSQGIAAICPNRRRISSGHGSMVLASRQYFDQNEEHIDHAKRRTSTPRLILAEESSIMVREAIRS